MSTAQNNSSDNTSSNGAEQMRLPDNAFRELKEGETYSPPLSPDTTPSEATPYSVSLGLLLAVIFSAAAAYLGLKLGQVFEAAIPIAIISIGFSNALGKKNAIGQNVIIQSIGASSGNVVTGVIFTIPAIYILQERYTDIAVGYWEILLSSMLGGALGLIFFIPFRKYFCVDQHGKYPFPEATATTQVLVAGQNGASQAKPLVCAGLIGGLYDFIVSTFGWWAETVSTSILPLGQRLAENAKIVFKLNTGAAVLGLGYIIGLRYCFVVFAGSAFIWFCLIPLMGSSSDFATMSAEQIFSSYARYIGIGGIAMSGAIGIIKSWGIIKGSLGMARKEIAHNNSSQSKSILRTQRDISFRTLAISLVVASVTVILFLWLGVLSNFWHALIAFVVVIAISFLFTTVSANAIAIVGSNPVSGMTLMSLIIASSVFAAIGVEGPKGIVASMIIGAIICTALAMSGSMVSDMKCGYWIGSTPAKQQTWKMLGTLVSAITMGGVIMILNKVYGFTGENALVAPQANAMAAVVEPIMMGGNTPWLLYAIGAILAVLLNFLGVPALAFSLGMFIPMELNSPLLVGGLINWYVGSRSKDESLNKARREHGTLLASGFIAGGALMGVVSAGMRFAGFEYTCTMSEEILSSIAIVMYVLLCCYLTYSSLKAKQ